ncbi:MAG: L,D-transpeptidase family protein [Hyphomicrobiaceae bacterium]
MRTRLGPGLRQSLATVCRPLLAATSLSALVVAAVALSTPIPAAAQSLSQPPPPDPDGEYGDDLQPFSGDGPLVAIISLGSQKIRVFDRNGLVATSRVSTGRKGYDTPEGIFSIIERKVEHNSNLYDDAEMPFMQRITWSGVALHEGAVPGYRASHGCIRLPSGFAERLFRTTRLGTRVVIVSHDGTLEPITHAALPQPGDPPPEPAPTAGPNSSPLAEPDHTGVIEIAATENDLPQGPDSAFPATPNGMALDKPVAGLAELRARRIIVERKLTVATEAVSEAKRPVRPLLIAQGKAEKALRQAIALANRAAGRAQVLEKSVDETTSAGALDDRIAAHLEALLELTLAQSREAEARETTTEKAAAAKVAQDNVRKLFDERQQILNESRSIARKLTPITIFVSREARRVFVHQAFQPVMDLPIEIRDPDRPLGTHVFTAQQIDDQADAVRWVGLTLETPGGGAPVAASSRKKRSADGHNGRGDPLASARDALDRIELPRPILARVMPILQPGSTVIISDLGKSIENGPGTDIIVQTKGEAAAARSIANFMARKRAERWSGYEASDSPRRRVRTGDWSRW